MKYGILVFLISAMSWACKTADKAPGTQASEEKAPIERPADVGPGTEHAEQDLEACMAQCQKQNAMRAVGPEIIEADCKASCTGEKSPLGTQELE